MKDFAEFSKFAEKVKHQLADILHDACFDVEAMSNIELFTNIASFNLSMLEKYHLWASTDS